MEGNELRLGSGVGSTVFKGCAIGFEVGTGSQGQEAYRGFQMEYPVSIFRLLNGKLVQTEATTNVILSVLFTGFLL
jgi:hypothetical protein